MQGPPPPHAVAFDPARAWAVPEAAPLAFGLMVAFGVTCCVVAFVAQPRRATCRADALAKRE